MNPIATRSPALRCCAVALAAGFLIPKPARGEVIEEMVARVNDDVITRSDLQTAEQSTVSDIMERKSGVDMQKELTAARNDLLKDLITKRLLVQQAEHLYDMTKMQDAFIRQFK